MTNPEAQVASYFAKYDPKTARLGKAVRARLRERLPGLSEIVYVYENRNALVISYSPSEHGYQGVVSLSLRPDELLLYFVNGAALAKADRGKILQGKASVRYVPLTSAADVDRPEIETLMTAALKNAKIELAPGAKGAVIIKAEEQKKRAKAAPKKAGAAKPKPAAKPKKAAAKARR